ncbi:MAG: PHP-associated domain-containing protein [Actinomycetota bacterium]
MRIDLQVHTVLGSGDSVITPQEVAAACVRFGLDGIGVTEHDPALYDELGDALGAEGLTLVPGREVYCGPCHVLVFSADRELLHALPRSVESDALDDSAFACVWAHPAFLGGPLVVPVSDPPSAPVSKVVHAVEVLNGIRLHAAEGIRAAIQAAHRLGLPGTGGSDAHRPEHLGRCFTDVEVEASEGPEGVVNAIREGRARPVLSLRWAEVHRYDYRDDLREFLG